MQQSSTLNYRTNCYNPIWKIRSLIQNLDAELTQLCNRSSYTKAYVLGKNSTGQNLPLEFRGSSQRVTPISMLAADNDPSSNIAARTLSSIYRAKVIDAYRNRRIFTVYGNYHTIRRALLRRGWLEKLAPGRYPKLQGLSEDVLLQHAKRGNDFEAVAISKIINHFPAFFIWQPKGQRDLCADVLPHRNRVRRSRNLDFSTKVGLIGCAEQEQWYRQSGVCGMSYPRFYRLGGSMEERMSFIEDFRRTQCRSLLKYLRENIDHPENLVDDQDGTVLLSVVSFALQHLRKDIGELEHGTLDEEGVSNADNEMVEWQNFIESSNEVLRKHGKLKGSLRDVTELVRQGDVLLNTLEEKRGDYRWDGCRNLWILKPGYQCRGIGIIIRSSIEDILQWATNNPQRRYIAQKYIERPLLIYKTKFDIRQYMLLSIGESTLSIWLYKDCYLRFSSQEFSIDDLRESIHLTNNSVQKKYKNKPSRDARLPKNNMWSLDQFKVFLRYHGAPENIWTEKIFAGFKENLVAVVMASLEETDFVENAFELYGCDFMVDEQYNPILIEINSTPDLSPSTEVTARICPMALKDLVKVIVDLPRNSRAPTGNFELVYEVNYKIKKDFDPTVGLDVSGKAMTLHKPQRLPYRPKYMKKPVKIIKKSTESALKSPLKRLRKVGNQREKSKSSDTATPRSNDSNIGHSKGRSLKSLTKQALALRYTLPK